MGLLCIFYTVSQDLFSFLSVVSHLQINAAGGDLNWKR